MYTNLVAICVLFVVSICFKVRRKTNNKILHQSTVYSSDLPEHVPGIKVNLTAKTNRAAINTNPSCPAFKFGSQCASDCRTMMTCGGSGTPIISRTCVNINPFTPYCIKSSCSASPDMEDPNCVSAFTCTMEGHFPDPTDCTKYHVCSKSSQDAELYQCPFNYVYDASVNVCTPRSIKGCNTVDCTDVMDENVLYTGNPAYYAFCKSGLQAEIFMFRCHDVQHEIFDLNWGKCIYNCQSEGNHVDRSNCYGYITCLYENGQWISTKQSCPVGSYFKTNACVPHRGKKCESEFEPYLEDFTEDASDNDDDYYDDDDDE